ncbi:MAG TPA: HD domain-containing protein [Clostridiales bacterium]|nr:HD domain-containing protein [Clostridiales bacterium]
MVLIHDVIEIYAGDTFAYYEQRHVDKEEREQNAANKIFALLPREQVRWFEKDFMDNLKEELPVPKKPFIYPC